MEAPKSLLGSLGNDLKQRDVHFVLWAEDSEQENLHINANPDVIQRMIEHSIQEAPETAGVWLRAFLNMSNQLFSIVMAADGFIHPDEHSWTGLLTNVQEFHGWTVGEVLWFDETNTLTSQGCHLKIDGDNYLVRNEEKEDVGLPESLDNLEGYLVFPFDDTGYSRIVREDEETWRLEPLS